MQDAGLFGERQLQRADAMTVDDPSSSQCPTAKIAKRAPQDWFEKSAGAAALTESRQAHNMKALLTHWYEAVHM